MRSGAQWTRAAAGLALAASLAAGAPSAVGADGDRGHRGSVQMAFARLGDQASRYGIRAVRWVPAADGVPAHAFVLGCLECAGATYDETGALTNSAELGRIPTSWILRVPEGYRQRLLAQVPFGESDQTIFRTYHQTLLGEGY